MGLKRREVITLLGGAAVAWPLAARAEQAERSRRVGVLMNGAASEAGQDHIPATLQYDKGLPDCVMPAERQH